MTTTTVDRPGLLRETAGHIRAHLRMLFTGIVLVVLGMLIGLLAVTEGPRHTDELQLDVTLSQHRDAVESGIARAIHLVLGPSIAPVVLLVVCGLLWWRRGRAKTLLVAVLTIVGWFSVEVGKLTFHRTRPPTNVVHALVTETQPDSFPSGHTAFAAALVCALLVMLVLEGRRIRAATCLGVLAVLIVAISRLVAGAHFYLDVLAAPLFAVGAIVGLCAIGGPAWHRIASGLEPRSARHTARPRDDAVEARPESPR